MREEWLLGQVIVLQYDRIVSDRVGARLSSKQVGRKLLFTDVNVQSRIQKTLKTQKKLDKNNKLL